ncbi:MAG: NUDIX domain-containing protein [Myxococcota bacterium]
MIGIAATVVVVRAGPPLEVVMVRRNTRLGYHGGAWVFPGGRIDPGDGGATELDRARAAAVREAEEEAGLQLRTGELVHHAHWTTPEGRKRRFAVDFFFAQRSERVNLQADGEEILEARWAPPDEWLKARDGGEIHLPPPTFVTLWRLRERGLDLFDAPVERILPKPVKVPGGFASLYPGDAGYEARSADAQGARHRSLLLESGWRYERRDR